MSFEFQHAPEGHLATSWGTNQLQPAGTGQHVRLFQSGVYPKIVEWFTSSGFLDGYVMTPERFCDRLMMGLDRSDSIQVRVLGDIEVEMTLAAKTFRDYVYLSNWDGMVDVPFSNIQSVFGVFTTKSKGKLPVYI